MVTVEEYKASLKKLPKNELIKRLAKLNAIEEDTFTVYGVAMCRARIEHCNYKKDNLIEKIIEAKKRARNKQ